MTIQIDPATGHIISLNVSDATNIYLTEGGAGSITFDMATMMNSTIGQLVRPTSFAAFWEVEAYVRDTGQPVGIREYYEMRGLQQGLAGQTLVDYVNGRIGYGFQTFFLSDSHWSDSVEMRFDRYFWGSVGFAIDGYIYIGADGHTYFNGDIRRFDDRFTFGTDNKPWPLNIGTEYLDHIVDPTRVGSNFDINVRGDGRQYVGYGGAQLFADQIFTDNLRAELSLNRVNPAHWNRLYNSLYDLLVDLGLRQPEDNTYIPEFDPFSMGNWRVPCFEASASVLLISGEAVKICEIAVGDSVAAFDATGRIQSARVTRLIPGITTEWIELDDGTRVTPGHRYLVWSAVTPAFEAVPGVMPDYRFKSISEILRCGDLVVDSEGKPRRIAGRLIKATDESSGAEWIEQEPVDVFGTVVQRAPVLGWRTYNFTVEKYHAYIAGGCRVHNACISSTEDVVGEPRPGDENSFIFDVVDRFTGVRSEIWATFDLEAGRPVFLSRVTYADPTNLTRVLVTWPELDEDGLPTGQVNVGFSWQVGGNWQTTNVISGVLPDLRDYTFNQTYTSANGLNFFTLQWVRQDGTPVFNFDLTNNAETGQPVSSATTVFGGAPIGQAIAGLDLWGTSPTLAAMILNNPALSTAEELRIDWASGGQTTLDPASLRFHMTNGSRVEMRAQRPDPFGEVVVWEHTEYSPAGEEVS